ncbi:energy-coupling factor ABC transporter ATP-binding protein [Candidatus Latescibacterota bacterium]
MADPAITCSHVTYIYEDGTRALNDVSFSVQRGELLGLIGHNGSGKSTLLMNLVGILMDGGSIEMCGIPLSERHLPAIRERVGFVFQDPRDQLFMSTIFEDVAFGPLNMGCPPDETNRRVEEALSAVGLEGFERRISYHLSGGEMRRAGIATVLAMSPEIILFDEPSSGLDPRAKRELTTLLKKLSCGNGNQSCTIMLSSHDLGFVRDCATRVIVLQQGRIVADGPAEKILNDGEFLIEHGL